MPRYKYEGYHVIDTETNEVLIMEDILELLNMFNDMLGKDRNRGILMEKNNDRELFGYKIVQVIQGKYVSVIMGKDHQNQYWINKPTMRLFGHGPMAVFITLGNVRTFLYTEVFHKGAIVKVFRCRYVPSSDQKLWMTGPEGNTEICAFKIPEGTDFADVVMLTGEEIEWAKFH